MQAKLNTSRGPYGLAREVKKHEGTYKYQRRYSKDEHRPLRAGILLRRIYIHVTSWVAATYPAPLVMLYTSLLRA
jgi:hypothetical protein